MNELHLKYVDDLLIAEAIQIRKQLDPLPLQHRPQPDPYHRRTGQQLKPEKSKVYEQILKNVDYAANKK